jgi:hypothetical protein
MKKLIYDKKTILDRLTENNGKTYHENRVFRMHRKEAIEDQMKTVAEDELKGVMKALMKKTLEAGFRKALRAANPRECIICGAKMDAIRSRKKTCSNRCRTRLFRMVEEERAEEKRLAREARRARATEPKPSGPVIRLPAGPGKEAEPE